VIPECIKVVCTRGAKVLEKNGRLYGNWEENWMNPDIAKTTDLIKAQAGRVEALRANKVLVGQEKLLDRMLIALITGGHILLEGVPGLAKTTAVKTLSRRWAGQFHRISFTPDLLPADVVGTMIYNPRRRAPSRPRRGPVFTNLLLADEINRAPAKVQSALLEAMQEHQVTIGDHTYPLPGAVPGHGHAEPDRAGRHLSPARGAGRPLHAQVQGRASLADDERRIMNRFTRRRTSTIKPVMSAEQILAMRDVLDQVYCDEKVGDYILDIVFATRKPGRLQAGYRATRSSTAPRRAPRST
jgi:MoxR-like ATPase